MTARPIALTAPVSHRWLAAALALAFTATQAPAAALRCLSECDAAAPRQSAAAAAASCHENAGATTPSPGPASGHSCRGHLAPCALAASNVLTATAAWSAAPAVSAPPPAAAIDAGVAPRRPQPRRLPGFDSPPRVSSSVLRL